jgi:uncharacterized membrane protein (UPF0136 family)
MVLPAHVLNCCVFFAGGLVYAVALWCLDFSRYPDSPMHLVFAIGSPMLMVIGAVGLVGYFRRSLPCALVYITGIYAFFLGSCFVLSFELAQAVQRSDRTVVAVFTSLLSFLFAFTMPRCYKAERDFVGELLEERRQVQAHHEDVALLHDINICKV